MLRYSGHISFYFTQISENFKRKFAPLINELSIRHLNDPSPEKRWIRKTKGECDEAERKNHVRPKYDFVNFSDNTRIGVFGKGFSFADIQKDFFK